jgi:hypothetical protein
MADYDNGINGATGDYLFPAYTDKQLADQARGEFSPDSLFDPHLNDLTERASLRDESKHAAAWVDPTDLAQAGWGVIFAAEYPHYTLEEVQSSKGLGLLLEHRKKQATRERVDYFKTFVFNSKWDKTKFLEKQQAPISGAVDPAMGVPYYLLIVGDPATIPYEFQYQLDVQYAVGRIYFDTLADYAHYAQSVVRAETEAIQRPRRLQFWGASNRGDTATQLSAKHLITPLADWVAEKHPAWSTPALIGSNDDNLDLSATKATLDRVLNQGPAPALLFTASHGVGYPKDHAHQRDLQGALVTQDWQPFMGQPPDPEQHLFAGDDIAANADLHGMIAFHFACYGLGTPQFNDFKHQDGDAELTGTPFVARLPQKLLSHSNGGALAVIGHVDRAWSHSFKNKTVKQWAVFQSALTCLMKGCPVGYAMEYFNQEYAELASDCNQGIQYNDKKDKDIATLWTRSHNARNFIVFGDPAVKVAVSQLTAERTQETEPTSWFKPSDKAVQPPRQGQGHTSEQMATDRLAQLEHQVQMLQTESDSLKQAIETFNQRLERLESAE